MTRDVGGLVLDLVDVDLDRSKTCLPFYRHQIIGGSIIGKVCSIFQAHAGIIEVRQ
jgi:hypothetical protein